jgi:hypothetical protein
MLLTAPPHPTSWDGVITRHVAVFLWTFRAGCGRGQSTMKPARFLILGVVLAVLSCRDSTSPQFGAPVHMVIKSVIGESAIAGGQVPIRPSVVVTDAQDRPVPGVAVTFVIVKGGGSIEGATQTTNPSGVATVSNWTLGRNFGANSLVASSGDLPPLVFEIMGFAPDTGVVAFDIADPAGDTMPHNDTLPPAVDLLRMRGDFKRDSLILTMTFASPVRPANAVARNSIGGEIELDMDDNTSTGYVPPDSNLFGASAVLGVDYNVDLFDAFPKVLLLLSGTGMAQVAISYPGNSVIIRIPLHLLGDDDGNFALAAVIGPYVWASDLFPNAGQLVVRREVGATAIVVQQSIMLRETRSRGMLAPAVAFSVRH